MASSLLAATKQQAMKDQQARSTATSGFLERLVTHDKNGIPLTCEVPEHVVDWDTHLAHRMEGSRIEKGLGFGTKHRRQSMVRLQAQDNHSYPYTDEMALEMELEELHDGDDADIVRAHLNDIIPRDPNPPQPPKLYPEVVPLGGPISEELPHAPPREPDGPPPGEPNGLAFCSGSLRRQSSSHGSHGALKRHSSTNNLLVAPSGGSQPRMHSRAARPAGGSPGAKPASAAESPKASGDTYVNSLLNGLHKLDADLALLRPQRRMSAMAVNKVFYDDEGHEIIPGREEWSHYARAAPGVKTLDTDGPLSPPPLLTLPHPGAGPISLQSSGSADMAPRPYVASPGSPPASTARARRASIATGGGGPLISRDMGGSASFVVLRDRGTASTSGSGGGAAAGGYVAAAAGQGLGAGGFVSASLYSGKSLNATKSRQALFAPSRDALLAGAQSGRHGTSSGPLPSGGGGGGSDDPGMVHRSANSVMAMRQVTVMAPKRVSPSSPSSPTPFQQQQQANMNGHASAADLSSMFGSSGGVARSRQSLTSQGSSPDHLPYLVMGEPSGGGGGRTPSSLSPLANPPIGFGAESPSAGVGRRLLNGITNIFKPAKLPDRIPT